MRKNTTIFKLVIFISAIGCAASLLACSGQNSYSESTENSIPGVSQSPSPTPAFYYLDALSSNNYSTCQDAVKEAVDKGETGAEELLSKLCSDGDIAYSIVVEELFRLASSSDAAESATAKGILYSLYDGKAGDVYREAFLDKLSDPDCDPAFFSDWLSNYAAAPIEQRRKGLAFILDYIPMNKYSAFFWARILAAESDTALRETIWSETENAGMDVEYESQIINVFLDGQIGRGEFVHMMCSIGEPAVSMMLWRAGQDDEILKKVKAAFEEAGPSLSEEDWDALLFSNVSSTDTHEPVNFMKQIYPAGMDTLISMFDKASDGLMLQKIIYCMAIYKPNDAINKSLKDKLTHAKEYRGNEYWTGEALLLLYRSDAMGFDDALAKSKELNGKFLEAYLGSQYTADDETVSLLAGLYNSDKNYQKVISDYFGSILKSVPTDKYTEGFNGEKVPGQDKNKIAVISVQDSLDGSSPTYNLTTFSLTLVPEKNRLGVKNLTGAGTVVFLHYVYTDPVAYQVQDMNLKNTGKTVYGYRCDCEVTKVDITSGKVLFKTVWEGTHSSSRSFLGEASDFGEINPTVENHPEKIKEIIDKK